MEINTVGVAGLGLLGRGIVACFLAHGFRVIGFTRSKETHAKAKRYIGRAIDEIIENVGLSPSLADEWPERYKAVNSFDEFSECDFVIESIAEDPDVKKAVFDQLEAVVRPETIIASNTSALPITNLQKGQKHPERFVGMHWAEPSHVTRFMELIRGEQTSDAVFEQVAKIARRIGKDPALVQKDIPGFIVNRIGYAIQREALYILEQGVADAETIDRAFRNSVGQWSTAIGPFREMDLTGGPPLYVKSMQSVWPTLSNATGPPELVKKLVEADARGTANGRGFFDYTDQEAAKWEELYLQNAWNARELMNRYFPLEPEKD